MHYGRHQPECGHGGETRERCARTVVVEKVMNLFLQRRDPSMSGARYSVRIEENSVVGCRAMAIGRGNVGRRERMATAQEKVPYRRHRSKRGCREERRVREKCERCKVACGCFHEKHQVQRTVGRINGADGC